MAFIRKLTNRTVWSAYKQSLRYIRVASANDWKDIQNSFNIILEYENGMIERRVERYRKRGGKMPKLYGTKSELYLAAYHDILSEIRTCRRRPERFKARGQSAVEAFLHIMTFMTTRWPACADKLGYFIDAYRKMTKIDDDVEAIAKALDVYERMTIEDKKELGWPIKDRRARERHGGRKWIWKNLPRRRAAWTPPSP